MSLKQELFYKNLEHYNAYDYLYIYLQYHLAPLIAGLKPSSTLNMTRQLAEKWQNYGVVIMERLHLEWTYLRRTQGNCILLFYRRDLLEQLIENVEIKNYLQTEGYVFGNVDTLVSTLVTRYTNVHCPHEIGVFLGIPLEDVKAFSTDIKKTCLLTGYWKVYSNLEQSKAIFRAYDYVKDKVMRESLERDNLKSL